MLDITLRSLSLLVYLFLISYFFSNWSTAIKSHREFYNVIWIVIINQPWLRLYYPMLTYRTFIYRILTYY